MKALSINQPWAWLILNGYKSIENRDWPTKYRGEFLIHSGKRFDSEGRFNVRIAFPEIQIPQREDFEKEMMGGIVGKVNLINVIHRRQFHLITERDRPWFCGKYGFILDGAESVPLQVCKGAPGFFEPDFNSRYVERKKP